MSIRVNVTVSVKVNNMTTTSQMNIQELETLVAKIKADIASKDVAIDHLKECGQIHQHNEQQSDALIKTLEARIESLEKEIEQLTEIDENDTKAKEVLVDVLKENKSLKDCELSLINDLKEAHAEVEEIAKIATNMYGRFTQLVENATGDGVVSTKSIKSEQKQIVADMAELVDKDRNLHTPAAMARMFNQEKHRLRFKNRKFKRANLKEMKKLWLF